ncbi:MAG: glycosyl hydrolase, partial [Ignavibacteriaceae bacterium]|nr:glycosyl hydrolase [Ignavibacteriaceae bacterium]
EGSVWGSGGERGLYKSIDGGKTWKKVLDISEHTGVNNLIYDPRNPDVMYATSEQRRRHVFTKIGGGPESAVYKSEDAGETWEKIMNGLPKVDIGGMGIDISPANPDIIYIIMEAAEKAGGFFRSTNRGASWEKMSSYTSSGQYFNEIVCDPKNTDKVYSLEVVSKVTTDAGKTWVNVGINDRHVDDHALWINPNNTDHLLMGGDGGIYESFDMGKNWNFKTNLPVTQFYRVFADNSTPFYFIYGGTQDNSSMGGPSRTISADGIVNSDWFITNGGDGFWSSVDPENQNIVYAESQYGGMVRYDKQSGEAVDIRPEPRKGENTYKWNWDTPLFISPHKNTRIYCAANKVFRSEDRGDTWEVISDDLSAQI